MKRESNEIKKENDRAASFMRFCEVVRHLRAEDGCPWDRAQTHTSLKPYCIEEAAEVIGGINIWEATGDAENLKEELGDLMLQILLHAQIAEEEGLFTVREVMDGASEKMIRRHPHVFGKSMLSEQGEPVTDWDAIKKQEKAGNEFTAVYLLAIEILSLKVRELFLTAPSISCRSTLTFPRHLDAIRIFLLQSHQFFLDLPDLSGSVIQNFQLICCKLILRSFDRLPKKIAVIIIVSAYHLVLIDRQEQLFPELCIG